MSITGALITLSDSVLYPFYAAAPRVWRDVDALADQQIGGLLMWVVGGLALWGAMTVVWFRWSVRERQGDAEQSVPLEVYAVTPR
jgi:cytochrome c oxidase assembly factor CtaG